MITQIDNALINVTDDDKSGFVYDLNRIEENIAEFDELNNVDLSNVSKTALMETKDHCVIKAAYWETSQMVKKINIK